MPTTHTLSPSHLPYELVTTTAVACASAMAIASISMSAPGVPSDVSKTSQAEGQTYSADLASPGTYLVKVTTFGTAQPYRLTFNSVWKGLQPDQFEVNNTFATAAISTSAASGIARAASIHALCPAATAIAPAASAPRTATDFAASARS